MNILKVKTDTKVSDILIGEHIDNVQKYLNNRKTIIITDSNLLKHYKTRFPAAIPIIEHPTIFTPKRLAYLLPVCVL